MYTRNEFLFLDIMRQLNAEGREKIRQLMVQLAEKQTEETMKLFQDKTKELNEMMTPEVAEYMLNEIIDEAPGEVTTTCGKLLWIVAQAFIRGAVYQYAIDADNVNTDNT